MKRFISFLIKEQGVIEALDKTKENLKEWIKRNPEAIKEYPHFVEQMMLGLLETCLIHAKKVEELKAVVDEIEDIYVNLRVRIHKMEEL